MSGRLKSECHNQECYYSYAHCLVCGFAQRDESEGVGDMRVSQISVCVRRPPNGGVNETSRLASALPIAVLLLQPRNNPHSGLPFTTTSVLF
jgi:hypothetical protein